MSSLLMLNSSCDDVCWRSMVCWGLANELDWRALEQDDEHLPEVERELQLRMRDKALAQRYLDTPQQTGEDGD